LNFTGLRDSVRTLTFHVFAMLFASLLATIYNISTITFQIQSGDGTMWLKMPTAGFCYHTGKQQQIKTSIGICDRT